MASCVWLIQSGNWPTCFAFRPLENNFNFKLTHRDKNCENFLFIDPRMDPSKSRCDETNFPKMDQSDWWVFQNLCKNETSDLCFFPKHFKIGIPKHFKIGIISLQKNIFSMQLKFFQIFFFTLIWPWPCTERGYCERSSVLSPWILCYMIWPEHYLNSF
jgi:hypothetical protein